MIQLTVVWQAQTTPNYCELYWWNTSPDRISRQGNYNRAIYCSWVVRELDGWVSTAQTRVVSDHSSNHCSGVFCCSLFLWLEDCWQLPIGCGHRSSLLETASKRCRSPWYWNHEVELQSSSPSNSLDARCGKVEPVTDSASLSGFFDLQSSSTCIPRADTLDRWLNSIDFSQTLG